jgi:hypothetical protein
MRWLHFTERPFVYAWTGACLVAGVLAQVAHLATS